MAAEAAIRDDCFVERIARAHGFRRSGRAIRDRVMTLARAATHATREPDGATFLSTASLASGAWNRPRYPATNHDIRPLEDIALSEWTAALRACSSEDPAADAARALGVRRLSAAAPRSPEPGGARERAFAMTARHEDGQERHRPDDPKT